jgi:hypothetical protein
MKVALAQCSVRNITYITVAILLATTFMHQVNQRAERRVQGHRATYDLTFNRIVENCKRNLPSHSQDKEEELIMQLFYPKARPGGGFFIEAGGLNGLT